MSSIKALFNLPFWVLQSCFKTLFCFSSSFSKSLSQWYYWRWTDKDKIGLREGFFELNSTLYINIKKWDLITTLNCCNLRLDRSIHIGVDFTIFNKFVFINQVFELLFGNEKVVLAMFFTRPWSSSCIWHTKTKSVRVEFGEVSNKSTFSSSWWSNHN